LEIQVKGFPNFLEDPTSLPEAEEPLKKDFPEDFKSLKTSNKDLRDLDTKCYPSMVSLNSRSKSKFPVFPYGTETVTPPPNGLTTPVIWHTQIKAYITL
jgi:hypothetical protein